MTKGFYHRIHADARERVTRNIEADLWPLG